jgi:hypothetical protein
MYVQFGGDTIEMADATDKQVSYVLGLLRAHGYTESEIVDARTSRITTLPAGDTIRNAVKSLDTQEASKLIERFKDA